MRRALLALLFSLVGISWLYASPPPAGTVIGNVATAVYYDENNNRYTTTSNLVQTVVQAIYNVDIYPQEKTTYSYPTRTVAYIPITVKNTGNAVDEYNVSIVEEGSGAGQVDFEKRIWWDKNQNGMIDSGEEGGDKWIIIKLEGGESIALVVEVNLSTDDEVYDEFHVEANSTKNGDNNSTNTLKVETVNDGSIVLRDSVDKFQAHPNEQLEYKVDFKNIGQKDWKTTNFKFDTKDGYLISAVIPPKTKFVGVNSGNPSENPKGYAICKAAGSWVKCSDVTDPENVTEVGWFMELTDGIILSSDQEGYLDFNVSIDKNATGEIVFESNTTTVDAEGNKIPLYGNKVITTLDLTGVQTWDIIPTSKKMDKYPIGEWIEFNHTIENNSTEGDIIELELNLTNTNLPDTKMVEFWDMNNNFKLMDSDGDGRIDTGVIPGESNFSLLIKVFIPQDADPTATYTVGVTGTSANTGTQVYIEDNMSDGIAPAVDFGAKGKVGDATNDQADGNVDGTNDSDDVLLTEATHINETNKSVIYKLDLLNAGACPDTYDLKAEPYTAGEVNFSYTFYLDPNGDGDITDGTAIGITPLMGGTILVKEAKKGAKELYVYDVANFEPNDKIIVGVGENNAEVHTIDQVDTANKKITIKEDDGLANDHSINEKVGELKSIALVVTPVRGTLAKNYYDLKIEASSLNNRNGKITDNFDAPLWVEAIIKVLLQSDQSDQLERGGTTTYQHAVINNGNTVFCWKGVRVPKDTQLIYQIEVNGTYHSPEYFNSNCIEALNPDENATFYVRVFAPSDVEDNTVEAAQIEINGTAKNEDGGDVPVTAVNIDTTTVISGFLRLTKDVNTTEVVPGQDLNYTIVIENIGKKDAIDVNITDVIPNYTYFKSARIYENGDCTGTGFDANTSDQTDGKGLKVSITGDNTKVQVHYDKLPPNYKRCLEIIVGVEQ